MNYTFVLRRDNGHTFLSKHCFEVKPIISHDVYNIQHAEIPQLVLE